MVHGVPGIVSAIDSTADAVVTKSNEKIEVKDERKVSKGYAKEKKLQQFESINRMLKKMNLLPNICGLNIWLGGSLPGFSGLGASAASSVAIARAIAEEFVLSVSNQEINEIAYEAEKAYAGNPSGIDNTAATFGGLLWFEKNLVDGPNRIEEISLKEPVEIVIGSTGIVANTKAMVEGVADRKKTYPQKYDPLFQEAQVLAINARKAIQNFDLLKVGELMSFNHRLLVDIGVSCKELDQLVDIAREQGAYGAKLTGGGGGGCMVALTPGKNLQEKVAITLENEGFEVLRTKIGIKRI
ncbi:mevalonate kinase [Candidatus Bathyarchaeota archaeon]|nr:mevalonate kinase [Candidatus Bathyarchaeota archaeon]